MLRVKDWNKFQHFRDRKPPWIKLYRDVLDDLEWHELDPVAAKCLTMIWLIASETDGNLPATKKLDTKTLQTLLMLCPTDSKTMHLNLMPA